MRLPIPAVLRQKLSFMPRENTFFFLLHQSAMNIQQVARRVQDLMENYENVEAKIQEIKDLEDFGDRIIHDITRSLHRTFVTPIDREDILALAGSLDDVVDANEQLMDHLVRDMAFSVTQKQNGVAAVSGNTTQSSLSTHSGTDTKQRFKSIRERIQYFDLKSPSTENVQTVQSIGSIAASPYQENATVSSHGTMSFLQTVGRDDGGHWK